MIQLDASGLLAWSDDREPDHAAVVSAMSGVRERLLISPFVLTEIDYMVRKRLGPDAQAQVLAQIESGALELAPFDSDGVRAARAVIRRYPDLRLSLADASIVVLAHTYGSRHLLTLDERDFRVLPGPGGEPFRLLPADA